MVFQLSAAAILLVFYGFYVFKLISQNRRSIKTNQAGIGNKPPKVLITEKIMSLANVLVIVASVCSIFAVKNPPAEWVRIIGLLTGVLAIAIFGLAVITMKTSWRVGIPEEKTELITSGIYQWSRNPAFVGFDLLYMSMCLLFFNIPLLVISLWAAVMLHLQILQEEEHMRRMFGGGYILYTERTSRYFGRR